MCRVLRSNYQTNSKNLSQGALICIRTKLPSGNPNYFKAIIGCDLQANGRYKEAISLNLASFRESKDFENAVLKSQIAGKHQHAAADTTKIMLGLARAYAFDDQETKAVETCEQITPILGETSHDILPVLSTAHKSLGDFKRARRTLEKCIEMEY